MSCLVPPGQSEHYSFSMTIISHAYNSECTQQEFVKWTAAISLLYLPRTAMILLNWAQNFPTEGEMSISQEPSKKMHPKYFNLVHHDNCLSPNDKTEPFRRVATKCYTLSFSWVEKNRLSHLLPNSTHTFNIDCKPQQLDYSNKISSAYKIQPQA